MTIPFGETTARYVRILVTANTVQPAAQIAELEVYGPSTGDTQAPTAPANLAFTEPASGQVRLTWGASTDNTGVTGYDVYANGTLLSSVAGNVTTYTDNRPANQTVTYHVRPRTRPATSPRTATPSPGRATPATPRRRRPRRTWRSRRRPPAR